jgi:hypothetical protein
MNVASADFEFLEEPPVPEWVMKVTGQGDGMGPRAIPLVARVGLLDVEGVVQSSDGTSFHGFLTQEPATGDELQVGWLDGDFNSTGINYQPLVG